MRRPTVGVDVLGIEVAVRQAAPDIRDHHAAIDVDPLQGLIVDEERSGAPAAGAFAAADARTRPRALGGGR